MRATLAMRIMSTGSLAQILNIAVAKSLPMLVGGTAEHIKIKCLLVGSPKVSKKEVGV